MKLLKYFSKKFKNNRKIYNLIWSNINIDDFESPERCYEKLLKINIIFLDYKKIVLFNPECIENDWELEILIKNESYFYDGTYICPIYSNVDNFSKLLLFF